MLKKQLLDKIIRVNHAGELGARRIYEGQLAFTKDPEIKKKIKQMYDSELEHLAYFEKKIKDNNVRPTIFQPIWSAAAFGMGAVTAMMGNKAAMACTYAVEEVIADHYAKQLDLLDDQEDKELKKNIAKFKEEEEHHHDIAMENEAENATAFPLLRRIVNKTSKMAIFISERF
jgi:3-demethoxyubiquinol 3-hydroxylase